MAYALFFTSYPTSFLLVARVSLIIQNVAVIICGILLLIMLMVEPPCPQPHLPSYFRVLEALVIIIGSIADLSSVGTKIAVEKDWVVVLAGSDKKLLARKNQSYFIFFLLIVGRKIFHALKSC